MAVWDVLGTCVVAGLEDPAGAATGRRTEPEKRTPVVALAWVRAPPALLGIALAGGLFILWDPKCGSHASSEPYTLSWNPRRRSLV